MMIRSTSVQRAALLAALLAAPGLYAAEVAGVKVDDRIQVGSHALVLNGAGLRSKFFVKVYVGALYVGQKATTPDAIYDSPQPRRIVMRLLRDLDAHSLNEALDDGLKSNHTPSELAVMQSQADQLAGIMKAIGKAREGDTIHRFLRRWYCCQPERGIAWQGGRAGLCKSIAQGLAGRQAGRCLAEEGTAR